jgi:hypothetical protein
VDLCKQKNIHPGGKMPGKRSNRDKVQHFFCPYCEERLWRLGGSKYHLYLPSTSSTQQALQSKSKWIGGSVENKTDVDPNKWIEAFFCRKHSKLWMLVSRTSHDRLVAVLASKTTWQHSTMPPPIDCSSSSVSEFTLRMSRRADIRLREQKT